MESSYFVSVCQSAKNLTRRDSNIPRPHIPPSSEVIYNSNTNILYLKKCRRESRRVSQRVSNRIEVNFAFESVKSARSLFVHRIQNRIHQFLNKIIFRQFNIYTYIVSEIFITFCHSALLWFLIGVSHNRTIN